MGRKIWVSPLRGLRAEALVKGPPNCRSWWCLLICSRAHSHLSADDSHSVLGSLSHRATGGGKILEWVYLYWLGGRSMKGLISLLLPRLTRNQVDADVT